MWAGEIEFQVAAILLDFPDLVSKPTPGIASLLSTTTWASKKRRSAIDVADADDFMLVDNHSHTAAPLPLTLSEHRSLFKPRRKSGSTKVCTCVCVSVLVCIYLLVYKFNFIFPFVVSGS